MNPASPTSTPTFLELSFSPSLRLVSMVREFTDQFYEELLSDGDLRSRLALSTHELLENAVKYSVDGHARLRIEHVDPPAGRVVLQTWSRPQPERLAELQERLAAISSAEDPEAHYLTLMMQSAKRTEGSGLGLGRVRAEGGMTLRAEVVGDVLRVEAETSVAGTTGG